MRRALTRAIGRGLLLCALGTVGDASACEVSEWFGPAQLYINLAPSKEFVIEVPLNDVYWSEDAHRQTMGSNPQLSLQLTTADGRLSSLTVPCVLKTRKIDCLIQEQLMPDVGGELQTVQLAIPARLLQCADQTPTADVSVQVESFSDSSGNPSTPGELFVKKGATFSKRIDLGAGNADSSGDSGIAIDFELRRSDDVTKGRITKGSRRLREAGSAIELSGSFSTKADTYFDSVRLSLGFEGRTTDLTGESFLRMARWSGFFRPEATTDLDDRDYVYGAQLELMPAIAFRTLNRRFAQPFPYVALGVEEVDPDKRESGTVPDNYLRAVGLLKWKLYLTSGAALTVDGEVRRNFDDVAGLERWTRRWDFTLLVLRDRSWKPFLKYSQGSEPPLFEVHEEAIAGISFGDALGGRERAR